jgi:O-antigen/teichoic acid export membrane protein
MSKFVSNIFTLLSATILGQVLGIVVTPLLSRLYTPADFGIFQLFISIVFIISVLSCFSYSDAINLPKKHEDAANIVMLCMILIVIITIFSVILLFALSSYIEDILNAPGLSHYFLLLPLAIICSSFAVVLSAWISRKEAFGAMAKANVSSSISGKSVSVISGFISPSPFGLIFGTIINDATLVVFFLKETIADFHFIKKISYERMKQQAYRYIKFPQYVLSSSITNAIAVQFIPFLFAFFFSPVIVGYYAMSNIIINLPLKLVGNSMETVFYQKACVEKNLTGSITTIVKMIHTRLISMGMFGCLIVMTIGPELFAFVLGAKWYIAGTYAQILAPMFFAVFISYPLFSIFNVLEMQDASLGFNILRLVSTITALIIGGLYGDPIIAVILLSCFGVVCWSWMNLYTLKIAGVRRRDAIREIIHYLIFGLFLCMPVLIAKFYAISSKWLIIMAIIMAIVYYFIVIYRDRSLRDGLLKFVWNIIGK